jgi:DNA-binding FadR family transcriptional regulator
MVELSESTRRLEDYEIHHQLDLELHDLILEAAGNNTLRTLLDGLNSRIVQIRMVHRPDRLVAATAEHIEVIDALLAGDPRAASDAMRMHLRSSRENLVFV